MLLGGQPPTLPTLPKAMPRAASMTATTQQQATTPHRVVMSIGEGEKDHRRGHGSPEAALDPEARRLGQMAPPQVQPSAATAAPAAEAEVAPRARVSMEELLPALVKRIAWAGDKKRGSVQMELGAGPHAGTVVTIHADEGKVRVELQGDDRGDLKRELQHRGFAVE